MRPYPYQVIKDGEKIFGFIDSTEINQTADSKKVKFLESEVASLKSEVERLNQIIVERESELEKQSAFLRSILSKS